MNWFGIILGASAFVAIGMFHPLVIKAEYYLGKQCWWMFLMAGLALCVASLFTSRVLSAITGVFAFSCFWSILELFQQEKRVKKGWFPENPNKNHNMIGVIAVACAVAVSLSSCSGDAFKGHVVDVVSGTVTDARIVVKDGVIAEIEPCRVRAGAPYFIPGFIDSHVHIESSMMLPEEFARIAKRHGTIGAICDPHEIANVLGIPGVELMLDNARQTCFYFAFGAPSCVPSCSTDIETSGAVLNSSDVASLLARDDIYMLSEMMNYPGVLFNDAEVMAKIAAAQNAGKPVDGHAPGLRGEERARYASAGISTDHECSQYDEAHDAVESGMMIQIREGSAAKNYEALAPLIAEYPDRLMFCTDDSHPTDLVKGHINSIVKHALADGYPVMDVLKIACLNPVRHYGLKSGLLQVGDSADFIVVSDLTPEFEVISTYIQGVLQEDVESHKLDIQDDYNVFVAAPVNVDDTAYQGDDAADIPQIVATDGSLLTGWYNGPKDEHSQKLVTYNRYTPDARPQVAYIRGFNINCGAIAQTIAHDCHNIIAVGSDDEKIVEMINRVIEMRGGIAATDGNVTVALPLPVGGILSDLSGDELSEINLQLEQVVRRSGCQFKSPFITLGFMALPVIPQLKLTDKGLFDGNSFKFVE